MSLSFEPMSCGSGVSSDGLSWLTWSVLISMLVSRFEHLGGVVVSSSDSESESKTISILDIKDQSH